MTSDFFRGIMRWNVERNGVTRLLPYFYYDSLSLGTVYTASSVEVRKLIPHPDLHPIELTPGRCLAAFAAFEYRHTDVDPYNEVNISFLVSHRMRPIPLLTFASAVRRRVISSYVWQLPVTTEHARAGGADLFGFPKFIADIQFEKKPQQVSCTLSVSGEQILQITGRVFPTGPGKPIRYVTYAAEQDSLVVADVLVNQLEYAESRSGDSVQLELGESHPIARTLKSLKLASRPLFYQYSPRNEAILFPARNV
jgi:hypothetical protein